MPRTLNDAVVNVISADDCRIKTTKTEGLSTQESTECALFPLITLRGKKG